MAQVAKIRERSRGPSTWVIALLVAELGAMGCGGTANVFDCTAARRVSKCTPITDEEKAHKDLDAGDYDNAITLLIDLIAKEPTKYQRYPVLAAAYAARAGLDIFNISQAKFSSGGSIFDQLSGYIPTPKDKGALFDASLADMKAATSTLKGMPAEFLAQSADRYAASANLQLSLYQTAYGVMYLDKFAISQTSGKVDINQLKTMTEADAVTVLASLKSAADVPAANNNPALQSKINDTLGKIAAQKGSTQSERIQAYVAAQQSSKLHAPDLDGRDGIP